MSLYVLEWVTCGYPAAETPLFSTSKWPESDWRRNIIWATAKWKGKNHREDHSREIGRLPINRLTPTEARIGEGEFQGVLPNGHFSDLADILNSR
ncbi:hypothetical protein Nepgr_026063 [Nepenthes gracilis]|uniref:Uncharacterized protein n=1 Tax=Nepenthes gracilis TaxID=150966 RepID=A0AAD3T775_NEPGR|nr:hypothetical protein Nepgr_026063 [Nepenthes gracilis]